MKTPKIKLEGGIGSFLLANFEKGIFAVVTLLGLYLIYSAFSADKFDADKVPGTLIKDAATARDNFQTDRWEEFEKNYVAKTDVVKDVGDADKKKVTADYPVDVFMEGERLQLVKRFDPVLLAVQDLEVRGVWGSLLWSSGTTNKIADLPGGELRKRAEDPAKKKREPKKRRPIMRGGEGEMEAMMQMEMEMQMQMEQEQMATESMTMQATATPAGSLPDEISQELAGTRVQISKKQRMVGAYFVSVSGVVPFKQQVIEFRKLSQTLGYDPKMDYPRYVKVDVERMNVALPEERRSWENITGIVENLSNLSVMVPPEPCEPKNLDARIVIPALPLLRTDSSEIGLHSKIPERVWFEFKKEEAADEIEIEVDIGALGTVDPKATGRTPLRPDMLRPQPVASSGVEMLEPNDAPDFKLVRFMDVVPTGVKYQYRVRLILVDPNLPISVVTGVKDATGLADASGRMSSEQEEMMMMEQEQMMMMMESQGSSGSSTMPSAQKVSLEHGNAKINESNLDADVRARIAKLKNSERFELEDKDLKFGLYTEWSEPSPEVSAPKPSEEFFAGNLELPKMREAEQVKFAQGEPRVELVMSQWSSEYSYHLPVYARLFEGSSLNVKQVVKLIDPSDLKIREIRGEESEDSKSKEPVYAGHAVKSDAVVLDISGGEDLPNKQRSETEFKGPAEVLVFDGEDFVLTDELDDMREFREHSLYEVKTE